MRKAITAVAMAASWPTVGKLLAKLQADGAVPRGAAPFFSQMGERRGVFCPIANEKPLSFARENATRTKRFREIFSLTASNEEISVDIFVLGQ